MKPLGSEEQRWGRPMTYDISMIVFSSRDHSPVANETSLIKTVLWAVYIEFIGC